MKTIFFAGIATVIISACNASAGNQQLQAKVDSLQKQLDSAYKPGLGEFMGAIQLHHAKLYFAGQHANWKLADFELHEIGEALDDIQHYATDRPESKLVPMLQPALDSINTAVNKQDGAAFNRGFIQLTNTCNACHTQVHYEFNKIIIPTAPPVTNQAF